MASHFFSNLNRRLIRPRSQHPDDQRREYIFNVLIAFFTLAAALTTISSGITHVLAANAHQTNSVPETAGFLIVTTGLWWLSRRGHYKFGAYILVGLIWLAALQLSLHWSIELPMAQLLTILLIVISGIMVSSRAAVVLTGLTSASTIIIGYLQSTGAIPVNISWLTRPLEFSDAIGLVVIYIIVGAISWLANKEIDSLLRRAWKSEAALAKERDQLEITVAKRTKELQQTQLKRELELQQFAEFGRMNASLLHDLASPLTAASLNLEQADAGERNDLVAKAMTSLRHIERYLTNARKQLQGRSERQAFVVGAQVEDVVDLLSSQARAAAVTLQPTVINKVTVYGDPVVFHRILANLVINAIQACESKTSITNRIVRLEVTSDNLSAIITVQDNGMGIRADDLPHIFEDFYSTKKRIGRGLGLGLSSVKRGIEYELNGTIAATSTPRIGTTFTITLPIYEHSNSKRHTRRPKISRQ